MINLNHPNPFERRHIGPSSAEIEEMVAVIGEPSLDHLINKTVPQSIRLEHRLNIPSALTETEAIKHLRTLASKNKVFKSYIGMGYYNTLTPAVVQRNILENPGWYTQYTPYQAEIAQGRLEALINYQTMVSDLTGMDLANASLLDEGTAAAEAMTMLHALAERDPNKKDSNVFLVQNNIFLQTLDVLKTRAIPQNIVIKMVEDIESNLDEDVFGFIVQYPDSNGLVVNYKDLVQSASEKGIKSVVIADILSLALLEAPGKWGVDVVVGSSQRFGVPMGYGGPHAAFFATRDEFKRFLPGRIIGVSIDKTGQNAFRMALQTREQHIKRDKATSNICTAQVLLAIMASMYGVYHGPDGIRQIAERTHGFTAILDFGLSQMGYKQVNKVYFDTLKFKCPTNVTLDQINHEAELRQINLRYFSDGHVGLSVDETIEWDDVYQLIELFSVCSGQSVSKEDLHVFAGKVKILIPEEWIRPVDFMTHPVFNLYHSETEMLRYIKRLESKDLSLAVSMIPLGSCTMKLNATTEMVPVTWPEFANIHPFVPLDQAEGYTQLIQNLEDWLCEITGFSGISFQPNSGAQGEYAGLMVIREYLYAIGETQRDVVLVPSSAHGTNPASAIMAGMKVVVVKCDDRGDIDVEDLKNKINEAPDRIAALMVTYPSTHGVFEESIQEICHLVHAAGGQVYMDGANMNAQVGLTSPAVIGADVCHLNLHKTFTIPHGGGGPGVGPIGVAAHLVDYLPGHQVVNVNKKTSMGAVSSAPYGSAGILVIPYTYILMMGGDGLTLATKVAILNANYIKARLEKEFDVLYKGTHNHVAHELIFDLRPFKTFGIEAEDVAKRLMDYGYHAPTVSFPVAGTIMIEPTESESRAELDKFINALLSIRSEIREVETGSSNQTDNVLKNAPHTAKMVTSDTWQHPYSREKAAWPNAEVKAFKFWPAVARIDNAYGDRNLVCSCPPIENYSEIES